MWKIYPYMKKEVIKVLMLLVVMISTGVQAQTVDYSVVSVNEEMGLELTKVSDDNDFLCMPQVKRRSNGIDWWMGHVIAIQPNGDKLAYLSARNNTTNIFLKNLQGTSTSQQRTNRSNVLDFSYAPNGKTIVFVEADGKTNRIFTTDAEKGYMCRQVTNNERDYSPSYMSDMNQLLFSRLTQNGSSIWSYNFADNALSIIAAGSSPVAIPGSEQFLCVRQNNKRLSEIWRVNMANGVEECVVSDVKRSFASPSLSPDGKWILMVGSSFIAFGDRQYANTDIYVCRIDGTDLTQLTYHAADDLSPVWSNDGKYIYFVSQRGSSTATANIWRMAFKHN